MSFERPHVLIEMLAGLDPADPASVAAVCELVRGDAFVASVLAGGPIAVRPRRGALSPRRGGTAPALDPHRHRRLSARPRWLAAIGVSVLALAASMALLATSAFEPAPVSAAISFQRSDRYIVARIVNPYASATKLRREFARFGLHITLRLLPVAPGAVGHVLYLGGARPSPHAEIEPLIGRSPECLEGRCGIGLRIPTDYTARAMVAIGRPARAGEAYVSSAEAGAFAAREPLHCSGLLGARVAKLLPVLRRKRLSVVRWDHLVGPGPNSSPRPVLLAPSRDYVAGVDPVAARQVGVSVSPRPLDGVLAALARSLARACRG
ncbi:MAG: hypothetical protein ACYCUM_14365 [Solirubrobacteraceae bacterium]